jgi:predicted transcriptional regulator
MAKSTQKISIAQMKAARSLLGWSQEKLAKESKVSIPTIRRLEAEGGSLGGRDTTQKKIVMAFHEAGIEFLSGRFTGVRMLA